MGLTRIVPAVAAVALALLFGEISLAAPLLCPAGTACDDGNACTTNDVCVGGVCVGGDPASGCDPCQAAATLPAGGGTFVGTTRGASVLSGSCGSSRLSPERVFRWTPAASGVASVSTCGPQTGYDTVVYLRTGSCTGPELGCNDDGPCANAVDPAEGSRLTATVTAGQTYYVVVDGWGGESGPFALTVSAPAFCGNNTREGSEECDGTDAAACASGVCGPTCVCVPPRSGLSDLVPEIVDSFFQYGATVDPGDVAEGCASAATGVDLLRFGVRVSNLGTSDLFFGDPLCPTPCTSHPAEVCGNPLFTCSPAGGHNHGHYTDWARYDLVDAVTQSVVVSGHKQGFCLLDGVDAGPCPNRRYTCDYQGISVGCSDLYESTLGCQYVEITRVPPGSYVLRVTVDPLDHIQELSNANNQVTLPVVIAGSACRSVTTIPSSGGVFSGTTSGASTLSGSCGASGTSPEKVFRWIPDASGTATIGTCSATGTTYDTVVYLRGDSCDGPEVACNDDGPCATTTTAGDASRITTTVTAGRPYYIVVDGYGGRSGSFSLTVTPPTSSQNACATATAIPAAGGVFTGSTSGVGTYSGSCVSSSGPERVFTWTPSRRGTATIQTCSAAGTNFDTVLYVRRGTCASGTQVACNDDASSCPTTSSGGQASRVSVAVTAGQTYFIFVDGYQSASGSFQLTVTSP